MVLASGVIGVPTGHNKGGKVGRTQSRCPEYMGFSGNMLCGELSPMYGSFQNQLYQGNGMQKVLNLKLSRFYIQIIVQVYGCQVTGGIVQESVLAAGVGRIYLVMLGPGLAVFPGRAGMPLVESVVELKPGIGAGVCGFVYGIPKLPYLSSLSTLVTRP